MAKASQTITTLRQAERVNHQEIDRLRGQLVVLSHRQDYLTAQLGEANLKLLYTMQMMTVTRVAPTAPSILILPGAPPPMESGTLLEFYRREREAFLAQVEKAHAQIEADARARANAAASLSPRGDTLADAVAQASTNGGGGGDLARPLAFATSPRP